jgi:predicted nucleotidyltransferase
MNTDTWLERFKREVLPKLIAELNPEKILLFGSRIKGTADENSDIDVIVVSNAFATIPFIERMSLILKMIRFPKHIDFICYSPEEFARLKNKSSVLMDALENGEVVKL